MASMSQNRLATLFLVCTVSRDSYLTSCLPLVYRPTEDHDHNDLPQGANISRSRSLRERRLVARILSRF
jgi:hypothetical protein